MSTVARVHHLNVGALQPYGGALFDGQLPGLVLIDTGTTSQNPAEAARRHSPMFLDR